MLLHDVSAVSDRIRAVRIQQKKTQAEIAEKAKISIRAYADIERGSVDMRVSSFLRICAALRITPDEVMTDVSHDKQMDVQELWSKLEECDADVRTAALRVIAIFLETV